MTKPKQYTGRQNRGETPTEWDTPEDARKNGGDYPNYWVRKSRSGHVMMLDDTKDNEHMTFQHRSGTMVQFLPDGGLQIVTNKGRYDVTFGEQRVRVTGAIDTKATGSISEKTEKHYNQTVYGDSAVAIKGSSVETAKNKNELFGEHHDVVSDSASYHSKSGTSITSAGAVSMSSRTGVTIGSSAGHVGMTGNKTAHLDSRLGTGVLSNGPVEVANKGGAQIKLEGDKVYINSGREKIEPQGTPTVISGKEGEYTV